MSIDHVALWVVDLPAVRDFYVRWFAGRSNDLYHNPRTGLRTYILAFDGGARLELMARPDVVLASEETASGWAHVSFALEDDGAVDAMARRFDEAGVPILDGPRRTGDGYYECVIADPEGNRVEIVSADYRSR